MLVDMSHAIGAYLTDVFITRLDWWVLLGLIAQALFTARFLVQWIASERAGHSVIPMAFWLFSIGGGLLLLVYALYRKDVVFIAGQAFGVFVYLRNLYFVMRDRKVAALGLKFRATRVRQQRARRNRARDRRSDRPPPQGRCGIVPSARPVASACRAQRRAIERNGQALVAAP